MEPWKLYEDMWKLIRAGNVDRFRAWKWSGDDEMAWATCPYCGHSYGSSLPEFPPERCTCGWVPE